MMVRWLLLTYALQLLLSCDSNCVDDVDSEVLRSQSLLQRSRKAVVEPSNLERSPDVLPGNGTNVEWLYVVESVGNQTTICLPDLPLADWNITMLEVKKKEHDDDGPCLFNYWPTCVLANRVRDYMVYPLPWGLFYATFPPDPFDEGDLHTLPGVAPLDSKLCLEMGWLDLPNPDELLQNFTLLDQKAEDHCKFLRKEEPAYKNLTYMDYVNYPHLLGNWGHPGAVNPGVTYDTMQLYENVKCNMGHYAVGCDMANCLYNFCRMPDGKIGSGRQCRKNWMDVETTRPHLSAYDAFMPHWQKTLQKF